MDGVANTSKPTVVFIHGAWHTPDLYAPLLDGLKNAKYPIIAPSLPSSGGSADNNDEDVDLLRDILQKEVDQGHEIVLLMHSYGGMVGSAAAKGLSKHDVKTGGVIKMIYLTAFALEEGVSLMDALNNTPLPWMNSVNDKQWQAMDNPRIFYNDVDPDVAAEISTKLLYQAKGSFESKQTYAAWKHIDSTYIVCENDNALPPAVQKTMANQLGGKFTVEYLATSHSPFLSKPQETVSVIRKAMGEIV